MVLSRLSLQNFRNYSKAEFTFSPSTTLIIGPNASGKSNLIETIHLLSTGKSFRTDKDSDMIRFGAALGRVKGETDDMELEVVFTSNGDLKAPYKKYLVNGVGKRRVDFEGILPSVLFSPLDLEIVVGSPFHRRSFLDDVLEQTDRDYRLAVLEYTKALRQRNALLEKVQTTGLRNEKEFEYWDEILIQQGQMIAKKREQFISFINGCNKEVFEFVAQYDRSEISRQRLEQYKNAEVGAGVTLVGPHRDEVLFFMKNARGEQKEVRVFGSRGQQRLLVLQLKLLQLTYIEKTLEKRPLLLLDDIFSELDEEHIQLVIKMMNKQQTLITTTHKEFVHVNELTDMSIIELGK